MAQIGSLDFATAVFKAPENCFNCPFCDDDGYGFLYCKHPDGPEDVSFSVHEYCFHKECPLRFVKIQPQFVKPDESKTIIDSEDFEAVQSSKRYEDAIIASVCILKNNEEALKQVFRNYDRLVKEKNGSENLDLPYWCYGFCGNDECD